MNFRLFNIPVHISPTFWLFLLFFTGAYQDFSYRALILGIVVFSSLLLHELGHAWTAAYFGAKPTITLEAFGGSAHYVNYGLSGKQEFFITLNGPLLESLLIVVPYFLLKQDIFHHHLLRYVLYVTMKLNILWCLLNLIPVEPLDGGKMAAYLLQKKWGEASKRISILIGLICVLVIAPYLLIKGFFFFGLLLLIFAIQNYQKLQTLPSFKQNELSCYNRSVEALNTGDLEKAKNLLKKLLKAKNPQIRASGTESLAKLYVQEGTPEKAYNLLLKTNLNHLKEGKHLLSKLAFERGNFQLAGKYARESYTHNPSYETALLNSRIFARLDEPAHSAAWLNTALLFEDAAPLDQILIDPHFTPIKKHIEFMESLPHLSLK